VNEDLAPDMSTPVLVNGRIFCVWGELYCLDPTQQLQTVWTLSDSAFGTYGAIIGGNDRVLVIGNGGQLVLVDANGDRPQIVSKLALFDDGDVEFYSHPALVGQHLYIRGEASLCCIDLAP
jgi:hypothetical protein